MEPSNLKIIEASNNWTSPQRPNNYRNKLIGKIQSFSEILESNISSNNKKTPSDNKFIINSYRQIE
jgi:hypothetical protein